MAQGSEPRALEGSNLRAVVLRTDPWVWAQVPARRPGPWPRSAAWASAPRNGSSGAGRGAPSSRSGVPRESRRLGMSRRAPSGAPGREVRGPRGGSAPRDESSRRRLSTTHRGAWENDAPEWVVGGPRNKTPRNGSSEVPGPRNNKGPPWEPGGAAGQVRRPVGGPSPAPGRGRRVRGRASPGRAPKARRPGLRPRDQEKGRGPERGENPKRIFTQAPSRSAKNTKPGTRPPRGARAGVAPHAQVRGPPDAGREWGGGVWSAVEELCPRPEGPGTSCAAGHVRVVPQAPSARGPLNVGGVVPQARRARDPLYAEIFS